VAVLHSFSEKTKRSRVKLASSNVSACARLCFRYLNF
jgi:hypothetical protein